MGGKPDLLVCCTGSQKLHDDLDTQVTSIHVPKIIWGSLLLSQIHRNFYLGNGPRVAVVVLDSLGHQFMG